MDKHFHDGCGTENGCGTEKNLQLEADRQRWDCSNFIDDEEVTLLHHKRDMNVPDIPGLDVCDGPDTSDTQRED